jgi:hypothetical protein
MVAYWTRTQGVIGRILVKSNIFFFHAATMLLFYIVQRIIIQIFCIFPKIFYHTSPYGPIASGASVDPTSQFCSSAMSILPIAESLKVRFYGSPQWNNVHTKFHPNPPSGSRVESCGQTDGQTDRHDQPYMRSFHAYRAKNA